jgi:hypothetical protein
VKQVGNPEIRKPEGSQEGDTLKKLEKKLVHTKLRDAQVQAAGQARKAMWKEPEQEMVSIVAFTRFYWSRSIVRQVRTKEHGICLIIDEFVQAGNLLSPGSDAEEEYLQELLCCAHCASQIPAIPSIDSARQCQR